MPNRLHEIYRPRVALEPQALNNTNATGEYFDAGIAQYHEFFLLVGAMAATKTASIQIYQATDASGTSAKVVTGALGEITANTQVLEATVALASVANTDVVTITPYEGTTAGTAVSFTKAASTSAASRTFADAAGLVTCVNNATYGVTGITASANGTTVTLKATSPGDYTFTVAKTENAGTITLATVQACAIVSLDVDQLDVNNDFDHIAAYVATTANSTVAATLYSGGPVRTGEYNNGAAAEITTL